MSEPPHKPVRRRRPTLTSALRAARLAGQKVRTAVVEQDGTVRLTFADETSVEPGTSEWDEALKDHGKHS
jgi:hypothetical protein